MLHVAGYSLISGALLLALIFTLLFGQNAAFYRTPLPTLHRLLTAGPGAAVRVLQRHGGRRAVACLDAFGDLCCERSNPTVQLMFLGLLAGCYWIFWAHVFPMLPLPGIPAWHMHTGTAAALACLGLFAAASFSDPGSITAANLAGHHALYPPDGLLYVAGKQCWTCGIPRPARSKHCRACGRCVARLDHHCIWLNNCVGLLNMRLFLAFLAATGAVCLYAAVLGFRVLRADLHHSGAWSSPFIHPHTDQLVYLSDSRRILLHYVLAVYAPQVSAIFFTGAAGCIVLGFLGYQLHLICSGLTTAEVFRRRDVAADLALRQEARELEMRVERQLASRRARGGDGSSGGGPNGCYASPGGADRQGGSHGSAGPGIDGRAALKAGADSGGTPAAGCGQQEQQPGQQRRGQKQRRAQLLPPHAYDRGSAWRNLSEVLFPHHHLQAAARSISGGSGGRGDSSNTKCD